MNDVSLMMYVSMSQHQCLILGKWTDNGVSTQSPDLQLLGAKFNEYTVDNIITMAEIQITCSATESQLSWN